MRKAIQEVANSAFEVSLGLVSGPETIYMGHSTAFVAFLFLRFLMSLTVAFVAVDLFAPHVRNFFEPFVSFNCPIKCFIEIIFQIF